MTIKFKLSVLLIHININIQLLQKKILKYFFCYIVHSCIRRDSNPGPYYL